MKNTTTTYATALEASTSYFGGDDLAAKVFLDKYALRDNEQRLLEHTPTDMHIRMASEFARIERAKFKNPLSFDEIFALFDGFRYIVPQGSPMSGIGNPHQTVSLSNCFVVESPVDSYGGILKTDQQLVQLCKRRGGVGTDLSNIRPAGVSVKNSARSATGIGLFMERYSNSIREVAQAGRRGALMLTLDVTHPESELFATIKNDEKKVTGANISLRLTDKFMDAVAADGDFELRWPVDPNVPAQVSKIIKAKELWKTIINSAWLRAEPGLLFWDNVLGNNAVECYKAFGFNTTSTNPCSELPLCFLDSCRLMLLNLFSYVTNPFTAGATFDWDLFTRHVELLQRLMDDMVDLELEKIDGILRKLQQDPEDMETKLEEIQLWKKVQVKCVQGRRTGSGITAEADMLAALGMFYGSAASIGFVEKLHRTMKLASYRASMEMSKELGPFPIWDWNLEKDTRFLLQIQQESPELYADIGKYGRRNIANLTIAPAGSVSILTQTSSGIEPLFTDVPYTRRKKVNPSDTNARVDFTDPSGDTWQEFEVLHPKIKLWMEITGQTDPLKSPYHGATAEKIDWTQRVKLQAAAQRHIDHGISSTLNLPEDVSEEKVAAIYETAWRAGCKGITVYRDNCRTGVLIHKENPKGAAKPMVVDDYAKRPARLACEVHHSKVRGQDYFVLIGLGEAGPYEVFCGKNGFLPKAVETGTIEKVKRGEYRLLDQAGVVVVKDIAEHCEEDEEALGRLASMSLRHGVKIEYVVAQMSKVKGNMTCLAKAISRALKAHVRDGTRVTGAACSCGATELVFQSGCVSCPSCGASKCS